MRQQEQEQEFDYRAYAIKALGLMWLAVTVFFVAVSYLAR